MRYQQCPFAADLLNLADLAEALSGDEGRLTLFAPTSSAFNELPDEVVAKLIDPVFKPQLKDVRTLPKCFVSRTHTVRYLLDLVSLILSALVRSSFITC